MYKAKRHDVVEDFHGTKVADPYRYMEDPDAPDTVEWLSSINKQANDYFSNSSSKEEDKNRLRELMDYPKIGLPYIMNGKIFTSKNEGLQDQSILYVREGDEDTILLNPNTLSEDGTVALANYSISNDSSHIAYATSTHGSDAQEIFIRNIESKEDLNDHIQDVKFTGMAWSPDNEGFYYSRFPKPGTVSQEDENNHQKVYYHKIGTTQADDVLIHEQPEDKELMFSVRISEDDNFLILHASQGTASENRIYIKHLSDDSEMIKLLDEQDASYSYVTNEGNIFYFQTNLDAPNERLIAIDISRPERENWQEIIPEEDDVMTSSLFLNGKFLISYLENAYSALYTYNQDGSNKRELELEEIGSVSGITRDKENGIIYFGHTSYLNPTTIYKFDIKKDELTIFSKTEIPIDTTGYTTEQVFFPSKDGTKISMFLIHHKDIVLNGKNPVILYGYGGFNISQTPGYSPTRMRWLEKGGVFAIANLRGGGEYGAKWHRAGMLENKQNVYDDFIAAGEWLIEQDYTNEKQLAIMGGSNGGLLVAACMVQRPDLFGAVICQVPVIDMLRYHKFTIGRYWMSEYGDPENPEHFKFLYDYSPLHNVKQGVKYPPVLLATAESDDRVVPAHAKKFVATLNEKAHPDNTAILRLEPKAGHGAGKPIHKIIDEWVDYLTFLDKELN